MSGYAADAWTLAPVSVLLGAIAMWGFRRTANREAMRQSINHAQAHLLEFWLFVDEPAQTWKSWIGLIRANGRFLGLLLLPLLVLGVPMTPIYFVLDAFYGSSPLAVNRAALVTLSMSQPLEERTPPPTLEVPSGMTIDSPPVRVFGERQVSWRIRPEQPLSGELQWMIAGGRVTKSVEAGDGSRLVSRKRTRSLVELIRYPAEARLSAGPVDWIEISYPSPNVTFLGLEAHWSIWFLAFSLLGAMLAPR